MVFKYSFRLMISAIIFSILTVILSWISGDFTPYVFYFNLNVLLIGGAIVLYLRQFDPDINRSQTLTKHQEIVQISQIMVYGMFLSVILFFLNGVGIVLFFMVSAYGAYRLYSIDISKMEMYNQLIVRNLLQVFLGNAGIVIGVLIVIISPIGIIIGNTGFLTVILVFLISLLLPGIYIRSILKFRNMVVKTTDQFK